MPPNKRLCPACQFDNGAPNVRAASSPEETKALDKRYLDALKEAESRGCKPVVEQFANAVAGSYAVHSVGLARAEELCLADDVLFETFAARIRGGSRTLGHNYYDEVRPSVESKLFPGYDEEIRFAAISISGDGVPSFGPITFIFKDSAIAERATVFEENSVHFFETHIVSVVAPVPPGFRTTWRRRGELAAAKLSMKVTSSTPIAAFQSLLMQPSSVPGREVILEVHIFGACSKHSIERVSGPVRFKRAADQARWAAVQRRLLSAGIGVQLSP